ncbi:MAG: hypothetical protein M1814_000584 [Vezdaea aestivalis]|nr:MAG: hypothetical protein M1814_000584 [Vezdaea aestivalis]
MFPERMGRVILDGYLSGDEQGQLIASDASFAGIFQSCVDNKANCPGEALLEATYTLIERAKFQPIRLASNALFQSFGYLALKSAILGALYNVTTWPALALGLNGLFTRNQTQAAALATFYAGAETEVFQKDIRDIKLSSTKSHYGDNQSDDQMET